MSDGFPFTFRCQRSGNCCARPGGVVRVDASDIARIAAHLGMTERAIRTRFVHPAGDRLRDRLTGTGCVFLASEDGHARCAIYPVRPEKCRTWPYWDELRDDPDALQRAMRVCPGIVAR